MQADSSPRVFDTRQLAVPPPFRCFAVRSEEPRHAALARVPYGCVQLLRTTFLDADALAGLAAMGLSRVTLRAFSDVEYAPTTLQELHGAVPVDLQQQLAQALQQTGVLGPGLAGYQRSLATRIDFLASRGAGFHNDVKGGWSACLFWNLTLAATEVEFVLPHAGLRLALVPGDLLVFDPSLAHGLCHSADRGLALPASFEGQAGCDQVFLTGELPLSDAQWAALDAPWLPLDVHRRRGALDLLVAGFDERSGTLQRLHSLRHCMDDGEG